MARIRSQRRLGILRLVRLVPPLATRYARRARDVSWTCVHVACDLSLITFILNMNRIVPCRSALTFHFVFAAVEQWLVRLVLMLRTIVHATSESLMLQRRSASCTRLVALRSEADVAGIDSIKCGSLNLMVVLDRPRVVAGAARRLPGKSLRTIRDIKRDLLLLIPLKNDCPELIF